MTKKQAITKQSILGPWLALSIAVVATLAGGVLYGKYSQRWGTPPDLKAAGAQVEALPANIGDWQLAEELTMSPTAVKMLECAGNVSRRYIHPPTGREVTVAVIVGPSGPTAVHTPEICYSSRAYEVEGARRQVKLSDSQAPVDTFWTLDFSTRNVLASKLRVYYAWSDGGSWKASESPRFEFAASPLLYKIQLATQLPSRQSKDEEDAGLDFLQQLNKSDWQIQ